MILDVGYWMLVKKSIPAVIASLHRRSNNGYEDRIGLYCTGSSHSFYL
jgi:hypothetical protein